MGLEARPDQDAWTKRDTDFRRASSHSWSPEVGDEAQVVSHPEKAHKELWVYTRLSGVRGGVGRRPERARQKSFGKMSDTDR